MNSILILTLPFVFLPFAGSSFFGVILILLLFVADDPLVGELADNVEEDETSVCRCLVLISIFILLSLLLSRAPFLLPELSVFTSLHWTLLMLFAIRLLLS